MARLRVSGGFTPDDFEIKLVLRMSSLKRAFLPSITIKVSNLSLAFTMDLAIYPAPTLPFLRIVNATFVDLPIMDFRVSPLSGVDLGSIPGVSAWLQSSLAASVRPYVDPGYFTLNISALYGDPCPATTTGEGRSSLAEVTEKKKGFAWRKTAPLKECSSNSN